MRISRFSGLPFLLLVSGVAQAQHVPTSVAMVALSPLLVVVLATALGIVVRSWRVGILHIGLLIIWVVTFLFVVQHFDGEHKPYIIWIPIVVYAAHTFLIVVSLVVNVVKRITAHDRPT